MRFLKFLDRNYEFFMIKTAQDQFFLSVPIINSNFHSFLIKLGFLSFSLIFPDSCFVRFWGEKS